MECVLIKTEEELLAVQERWFEDGCRWRRYHYHSASPTRLHYFLKREYPMFIYRNNNDLIGTMLNIRGKIKIGRKEFAEAGYTELKAIHFLETQETEEEKRKRLEFEKKWGDG